MQHPLREQRSRFRVGPLLFALARRRPDTAFLRLGAVLRAATDKRSATVWAVAYGAARPAGPTRSVRGLSPNRTKSLAKLRCA